MSAAESAGGAGLAGSASRGALVTLAGQAVRVVIQLAGIVVLARLLGPSDYGLVAMVTVIIGVGEVFRDFGLSSAAIQAKILTPAQKDNLFWINGGIGLLLTLLVCALASPIADFYGDPRLQPLSYALSLTFLLNGLSTQFRADLSRHLRFSGSPWPIRSGWSSGWLQPSCWPSTAPATGRSLRRTSVSRWSFC